MEEKGGEEAGRCEGNGEEEEELAEVPWYTVNLAVGRTTLVHPRRRVAPETPTGSGCATVGGGWRWRVCTRLDGDESIV